MFTRITSAKNAVVDSILTSALCRGDRLITAVEKKEYERQIAASQKKIGPYKPATIPVQVWA